MENLSSDTVLQRIKDLRSQAQTQTQPNANSRSQPQWQAIIQLCQQWLDTHYNDSIDAKAAQFHKHYIHALIQSGSTAAAFSAYKLVYQRQDAAHSPNAPSSETIPASALLCCCAVRNERHRLPYFLSYYRAKGVNRFLFVDNGSTDDTLLYLRAQPDVLVWRSTYSFGRANFGSAWFEILLNQYGIGHWTLTVDADELIYYPNCEQVSLSTFCQQLETEKAMAYGAILIDMYSERSIEQTHYKIGEDFSTRCSFFDRQFYHKREALTGPFKNQMGYWGGVRRRMFGGGEWHYCLNKVPLLKYREDCVLVGGQHAVGYPVEEISSQRGGLLHFKFFSSFTEYAATEAVRAEHADGGAEYRQYVESINQQEGLSLYSPEHSVRFRSSQQLVELGIIVAKQTALDLGSTDCEMAERQHTASEENAQEDDMLNNTDNQKTGQKNTHSKLLEQGSKKGLSPTSADSRRIQLVNRLKDKIKARTQQSS